MVKKQNDTIDIVAVAKAAGVSISTVSRSYNHPGLVKAPTRKKIEKAVQKLGYIRNRAAQVMHGRRSGTIGLIVPTIDHAIFAEVTQAFSDEIDEAGFTILIASHGFDLEREYLRLRKLLEHRVDGIALIGLDHSEATYQLLQQQGIPAIAIWNYDSTSKISCIGADNFEAGRMAAEHLLSLGHREIGLIFPETSENDRARNRLMGALSKLKRASVKVPEGWQIKSPYRIGMAKDACKTILEKPIRPTALLCGNDIIAQGAVYGALQMNLSVPQDISIMGIGDFKGSGEMEPALSTIRIPAKSIGHLAGKRIVEEVTGEDNQVVRQRCELRLMARSTTIANSSVNSDVR
jgi:LacI family transcriptional regulator